MNNDFMSHDFAPDEELVIDIASNLAHWNGVVYSNLLPEIQDSLRHDATECIRDVYRDQAEKGTRMDTNEQELLSEIIDDLQGYFFSWEDGDFPVVGARKYPMENVLVIEFENGVRVQLSALALDSVEDVRFHYPA